MSVTSQIGMGIGTCLISSVIIVECAQAQTGAVRGEADSTAMAAGAESPAPNVYKPMTEQERLRYYFQHMFSPESFLRSGAGAGINQALDTPHEWGQGAQGYGRRYASSYGGHIVQSTVMYGAGAVLHEDDRYFRSGLTGFRARMKYALESTFLARHDDGSRHFSFSRIGSYGAAAGISRLWQPASTRGPVHAADSFAIFVGSEAGFNVAREFLPGLFHTRPAPAPYPGATP